MDKRNALFGTFFIVAAAICFYVSNKYYPARPNPAAVHQAAGVNGNAAQAGQPPTFTAPGSTAANPESAAEPTATGPAPTGPVPEFASAAADRANASVVRLQNSFIDVAFSNYGGAIRNVALEKYPAAVNSSQPFVLNELHKDQMAAFVALPGLDSATPYQLVSQTGNTVVYRAVWNHQIEVTRTYRLAGDNDANSDPYLIRMETAFRNLSEKAVTVPVLQLALGTAAPVNTDDRGAQLATIASENGSVTTTTRSQLQQSGGILGVVGAHPARAEIQTQGPLQWAAVENQFFVSLLTPDQPASGLVTRRVKLLSKLPDADASAYGVTADAVFSLPPLSPGATAKLSGTFYAGPKEYHRLANIDVFKNNQEKVMNFGWFKFFSALLLTLMTAMHKIAPNWGLAIILTTLLLKLVFLPFTLAASRSAKRMQKLQPQMAALKEKYKDNPQKQQMATMELFKQHRVNPFGSCLPSLITLPFFWGFYRMLYSAAELRFAPFLWAHDLSAPDTVAVLFGIPINVLPLILFATIFLQMHFTPQPSVDNSQAKMMKLMPLLFLFFCYSYSCALSLYSTVNALFSIVQQLVINRMKDPEPRPATAAGGGRGPGGKALKNVTPRRT